MKIEKVEITKVELSPFLQGDEHSLNDLVSRLFSHQMTPVAGFPKLMENINAYKNSHFSYVQINGIKFRLFYNPTRKENVKSETFTKVHENFQCPLCDLMSGQRGIKVLDDKYMIIMNPGITIPGDLTIPTIQHDLQLINGRINDMLVLSRQLDNYSIFFNGPMAGASCPHFHFQAGLRDRLPAEIDINYLLNNQSHKNIKKNIIHQNDTTEIFRIDNFLRSVYCCYTSELSEAENFGNKIIDELRQLNATHIQNIENIPNFGSYIDVFNANESEARFNMMAKYYQEEKKYLFVVFPKLFNRPQSFFQETDKITLGFAIKEALGHVLTANKQDYYKILNNINILKQAYIDTSISQEFDDELFHHLKGQF